MFIFKNKWQTFRLIIILALISIAFNGFLLSSSQAQYLSYPKQGNNTNPFDEQSYDEILSTLSGRIPILMYHNIITPANQKKFKHISSKNKRYFVTSAELEKQLYLMHSLGYRNISLDEYLSLMKGSKKNLDRLSPGTKPYVLTFDDATYGQLDFSGKNDQGLAIIDPNCAVGIMLRFAGSHPQFKLNAAFSIDFANSPFMVANQVEKKLNLLLDYGFEIVNHTASHKNLAPLLRKSPGRVDYEIGRAMELFESYLGYRVGTIDKICYPGGKDNTLVHKYVQEIHYKGRVYKFRAALDAEGMQAQNPNTLNFNPFDIARIEINTQTFDPYILDAAGLYQTPELSKEIPPDLLAQISDRILEDK